MSERLIEHFARLDGDRDNDRIGPRIPLVVLPPWRQPVELWGEATVRREGDGIHVWAQLVWGGAGEPDYSCPVFRLPITMAPSSISYAEVDWRAQHRLIAHPDGLVYAEPFPSSWRDA